MSDLEKSGGGFNYDGSAKLNLRDIRATFRGKGNQIFRDTDKVPEPLWEGFFGFFEGPLLIRNKTVVESINNENFYGRNTKQTQSLFGIPYSHHNRSELHSETPGAILTALSAYVVKTAEEESGIAPYVTMPYVGDEYPEILDYKQSHTVSEPLGLQAITLTSRPSDVQYQSLLAPKEPLYFAGELCVKGANGTLPDIMESQTELLGKFTDPSIAIRVVNQVYGGDQKSVEQAWKKSMRMRTGKKAARNILNSLS